MLTKEQKDTAILLSELYRENYMGTSKTISYLIERVRQDIYTHNKSESEAVRGVYNMLKNINDHAWRFSIGRRQFSKEVIEELQHAN